MIIGISGLIGSGKDTVADYFVNHHNFRRESWAETLKDAVAIVFGWDRVMLEGKTRSSREWREQPDAWWSERLGMQVTPRNVLQQWGTDVCRKSYHDDIWIASLENKIRRTTDDIVISDCRFANELVSIKNLGGITIRVKRGSDPVWADLYRSDYPRFLEEYPGVHASEYSSFDLSYDHVIENNGTIDALHNNLSDLLLYRRSSR
jgi:hypothetical protein